MVLSFTCHPSAFNSNNISLNSVDNLKNIDIELPKNKLIVMTGLSGSGKSSLAFDTIYAPEPDNPVITISLFFGNSISIFFKLCARAPLTTMDGSFIYLT
jgi:ABC-type dipeptide/oligopeptide/nickel transport system ATPase component